MKNHLIRASYQDEAGRHWVTLVPQGMEQEAHMGVPVGPPSLESLGLPEEVSIRLHNQLFQRGLLTKNDLRGKSREIVAAIQAAYRVDYARVTGLFE